MRLNLKTLFCPHIKTSSRLFVSVADTPVKQQQGLMFRNNLPEDRGMLFIFARQQPLSFWGENTFIPLDIAFVDKNGIIKKIDRIAPMSRKAVSSEVSCLYAVEANDGFFNKNNISIGDKIFINKDNIDGHYLSFTKKRRNSDLNRGTDINREITAQIEVPTPQDEQTQIEQPIVDDQNLPVLDVNDLGKYLEDDLENQTEELPLEQTEEVQPTEEEPAIEETEFEYPKFGNVFEAAKWAEQNNEVMRISYTTMHGTGITRDIEPHGDFHAKTTNHQILVTFDQTIGDIRAFILTNINAFSFVGERFEKKFMVV